MSLNYCTIRIQCRLENLKFYLRPPMGRKYLNQVILKSAVLAITPLVNTQQCKSKRSLLQIVKELETGWEPTATGYNKDTDPRCQRTGTLTHRPRAV